MTEFKIICEALARVGVDFKVTEFQNLNQAVIEIEDSNDATTELCFEDGKLIDRIVWW